MNDLTKAIKITKQCFKILDKILEPGMTEKQVADLMKNKALQLGAKKLSFTPIVSFGINAKAIHPKPTNKKLKENQFAIIDFGVVVGNKKTDVTRTFCLNPDIKKLKLIKLIQNAKKLAENEIKSGVPCSKVDIIVRNYLKKHTKYKFPYALGHGVGKRIHQKPKISPKSKDVFKVGDIFTLEPGLHGSFGGIRIEDMYLLTKKGIKNLTKDI